MLREDRYTRKNWLGQKDNSLVILMAMLVIVFCIFKFILMAQNLSVPNKAAIEESYYKGIFNWFILPSDFGKLLTRPWTLLTYMFMHDGVFHMIGNLIWLWIFGYIMQDLTGNQKIIPLSLYGGVSGGLLFLASMNIFPGLRDGAAISTLEGASAGVMAIAIATTLLAPNYRFFPMINGGIPLWVITVIYIIVDIAMIADNDNTGGHISHIGGAIIGALFMWQLRKGKDWTLWLSNFFSWVNDLFRPQEKTIRIPVRKEHHYNTAGTEPYKKTPHLTQKRIDEILDKIGEKGYHQLTEEEKQILKRASEDDNL